MAFKTKYRKLEAEVDETETFHEDDFTRITFLLKDDRYVHFELPKAVEVKKGEKALFHDCEIKKGGWWYIDNKSYTLLEIFSENMSSPYFT